MFQYFSFIYFLEVERIYDDVHIKKKGQVY